MSLQDTCISAVQAASREWDVIVVGAGSAGTVAARQCAGLGAQTLLIDRGVPPRDKVCGGCLGYAGVELLNQIGLGRCLEGCAAAAYDRIRVASRGRCADLQLAPGRVVERGVFDQSLINATVECGVEFLPSTSAVDSSVRSDGNLREVGIRSQGESHTIRSRCVVAADGLGGRFTSAAMGSKDRVQQRSRMGFGTAVGCREGYEEGTVFMALGKCGYLGVVRASPEVLIVAGAFRPRHVRGAGGPCELAATLLAGAGMERIDTLAQARWKGTQALTRCRARVAAHRLLAIGDTNGYAEPITGEGMTWAIASGIAVAEIACESTINWDESVEKRWAQTYRQLIRSRQRGSGALHRVLNHEWARDLTLRALSVSPRSAVPFTSRLARPYPVPTRA